MSSAFGPPPIPRRPQQRRRRLGSSCGAREPQVGAAGASPAPAPLTHPPAAPLARLPPTAHPRPRAHSPADRHRRPVSKVPGIPVPARSFGEGSPNPSPPPSCKRDQTSTHQVKELSLLRPWNEGLSENPPDFFRMKKILLLEGLPHT